MLNNTIGIKIGKLDPNEFGPLIGLNENDIVIALNDINTADISNRIKIYDTITQMKKGENIKISLKRGGQDITLNYKLERLERPRKKTFIQPATEGTPESSGEFKMSEQQKREKIESEFEKLHKTPKHKHVISDIRKRLLENMKSRSRNRRVR